MMRFARTALLAIELLILLGAGRAWAQTNTALGDRALQNNTSGILNTALGELALLQNSTGNFNTATGAGALSSNTNGQSNTATGAYALNRNSCQNNNCGAYNTATGTYAMQYNTTGYDNTAIGASALERNTTGYYNTAIGAGALLLNDNGLDNTAIGVLALQNDISGQGNTAIGVRAMQSADLAIDNTAIGVAALSNAKCVNGSCPVYNTGIGFATLGNNTIGGGNIAVGYNSGVNLTVGNFNIDIGNEGVAGEAGTIRIGDSTEQTRTFIAGISGVTTGGRAVGVVIDSNGQLGTISSSRRFKDEIRDMGEASRGLARLRPVTFRYKGTLTDGSRPLHYGLIAEEVSEVYPELVAYDPKTGEPQTVLYHELPAMLLNELQKQAVELSDLRNRLANMEAALRAAASSRLADARQSNAAE